MAERPAFFPAYTKTWHNSSYPAIDPTRPELSAKGKSILITGGGTGIGLSTALSFAAGGASHILLLGRRPDPLKSALQTLTSAFPNTHVTTAIASTLSVDELTSAISSFHSAVGPIDVLVANAGYLNTPSSIAETDPSDWWNSFSTNVLGTFNTMRAFLPYSRVDAASGENRSVVVNISSGIAHLPAKGMDGMSAYAASKVASAKMGEYLAEEVKGLRVVNVQPGVVGTSMNLKHGGIPAFDEAELPANFIVWLSSPEATFLHGKFVWVNWDVEELKAKAKEIEADGEELSIVLKGPAF